LGCGERYRLSCQEEKRPLNLTLGGKKKSRGLQTLRSSFGATEKGKKREITIERRKNPNSITTKGKTAVD